MDYAAALAQARRVLDDPQTPAPVRENVERFIAGIEAAAKPHAVSFFGSFGLLYDSNVTAGPASPTYELATGLLTLDPDAVRRADHAITLTLGISHRYLAWPAVAERRAAFLWQSTALVQRFDYRDEHGFDLDVLALSTGPAWIFPPRLRVSLPLQLEHLALGGGDYLDVAGAAPAAVLALGASRTELELNSQFQRRDYRRGIDAGRDSRYAAVGLQLSRLFGTVTAQAGARAFHEDAEAGRWDHDGDEWFAVLGWQVRRFSAYARFVRLRANYNEPDPLALVARHDRQQRFAFGASYRIATGGGDPWSLRFVLLEVRHRSDVSFYGYERRQATATLAYGF
jgi:hypothetical protein